MAVAREYPHALVIDNHLRTVAVKLDLVRPAGVSGGAWCSVGICGAMNFKRMN
jgi:hypothetical protein